MNEREILRLVREHAPHAGDDCAVLPCAPWGHLLVTVDAVIDGVHAVWSRDGARAFGRKAVLRGLSDVAAMGGEPLWAVASAILPAGASDDDARALLAGLRDPGCELVGGDTAFGPTATVTVTVLGRAENPVRRSGARVGDRLVVSGPLGNAVASGRHLDFPPRVREARELCAAHDVGAMIDLSDGLASDLFWVLDESGVGARIAANAIPRRDGATWESAVHEGEDYELLATVEGDAALPAPWVEIGRIVPAGENDLPFSRGGYEHRG